LKINACQKTLQNSVFTVSRGTAKKYLDLNSLINALTTGNAKGVHWIALVQGFVQLVILNVPTIHALEVSINFINAISFKIVLRPCQTDQSLTTSDAPTVLAQGPMKTVLRK
jgi:hypothetical protein